MLSQILPRPMEVVLRDQLFKSISPAISRPRLSSFKKLFLEAKTLKKLSMLMIVKAQRVEMVQ